MPPMPAESFNDLVEEFLGARLPGHLADGISFPSLPAEVQKIVLRMLGLMRRAGFPATDFTEQMIWLLATVTPAMLPAAWGGRIPPLTAGGRHKKLDAYVARYAWGPHADTPVFVDLGCGFPPLTTVDTARHLPQWRVFGVDPSFAAYVLDDAEGNYACFDQAGEFLYYQPSKNPLHDNPRSARERFQAMFALLAPRLPKVEGDASATAVENCWRLVHNPIHDFERLNLKFIEGEIEHLGLPPARAVRCMNVLLYFDQVVRRKMHMAMHALLTEGGLLITGFNHPFGTYARYAVHRKEAPGLHAIEFAFSLDNLRPLGIGPWVTIEEQDETAEMLADLIAAMRADGCFWPQFDARVDRLRARYDICRRDGDGFIHFTEAARSAPAHVIAEKVAALWHQLEDEGYTDGAVDALKRAGYHAWKNPVGDIAVRPPDGVVATPFESTTNRR